MRSKSLLIIGTAYTQPTEFPRCDATWTTLSAVNADLNIAQLPNLRVWDCHGREVIEDKFGVGIYDIRDHEEPWRLKISEHGQVFINQFCYMMADVASSTSPFNHVTLFGVGGYDQEHVHQFQYMTYWLGYLQGLGVSHTICQPSALLRPATYVEWREK